ncbi:hypothetical protein DRQ25_09265 [Candidatus Fermentibacteria bacterium]|nr:MAG: hypothetical protein DRQ25_09265 [Candidatus Fermentibacteria bacterium]
MTYIQMIIIHTITSINIVDPVESYLTFFILHYPPATNCFFPNPRVWKIDRMRAAFLFTIILSSLAAAEWHIQTVDSPGYVGGQTSLALDAEDHPHISYYDYAYSALKYAYWNGSYWETEIVDNDGWNGWLSTSLALDSNGYPHISYQDNSYQVEDLKYTSWSGSSWVVTTVDSIGDAGMYSSLILDAFDNPHIAYTGYDGLRYASRSDTGIWVLETIDYTGGMYPSLAFDSSEYPHIAYYHYAADYLKYAYWTGSSWVIETIDHGWFHLSLALDSSDIPHIAYYIWGTDYDLKYANRNNSVWEIETVDSVGAVGAEPSLTMDTSNNPHISYLDFTNNSLKYAYWTGSSWNIETVDSESSSFEGVGYGSSIALDSTGNPHISYSDGKNYGHNSLKYAYYVPLGIGEDPDVSDPFLVISPNPSNSALNFIFLVSETGLVDLMVFDLSGRLVREFSADEYSPGFHNLQLTDLAPGIYFCKMTVGDFTATQRFAVIE